MLLAYEFKRFLSTFKKAQPFGFYKRAFKPLKTKKPKVVWICDVAQ